MTSNPHPSRVSVSRRALLSAALVLPALTPMRGLASDEPPGPVEDIAFTALRNGAPFGAHEIQFTRENETLHVDVAIDLRVGIGFIPLFRYRHRARELWRDGRLISLESQTRDGGEDFWVRAEARGDRLRVLSGSGAVELPGDITPTSYWRPETPEQNLLLDTQRGRALEVESTQVARERVDWSDGPVTCDRHAVRGDLNVDLWYAEDGALRKIAFEARGSEVEYAPQA